MSTFIPPTPAATKSAEQHEEPSEQDTFNHLLFKVLRLTSEQVQDLNDWMIHQGTPNVHEVIVVENSSSRFYLISFSQGILNSSRLLLLSSPKIACLHVSFTAYENFYKLSKMHCHLGLTFHFLILRMSGCRNPTIKHISTYTLVSSSITTYVTDLFLGSNLHSKIPF